MIIIEKLRKKAQPKRTPLPEKSIGIIDFYHSDLYDSRYPHFWHCEPHTLRSRAEQYLESHGVLLAQHRGVDGVSPWETDQFEADMQSRYGDHVQVIYDVDLEDLVESPPRLRRHILATKTLLFGDLTEGTLWGKYSTEFLMANPPQQTSYFLTCNLAAAECREGSIPGMVILPWANSFSSITVTNQRTKHLVDDHQAHLDRIDQSYSRTPPHTFLSINGKPRMPRLNFLTEAWRRGLLDRALWSLGYYPEERERMPNEYLSIGHRSYSGVYRQDQDHSDFLDAHEWPRLIGVEYLDFKLLFDTPMELMDQANWHVVIETCVTKPNDRHGAPTSNTLITEKFYKAVILGHPVIPLGWQGCHHDIQQAGYQLPQVDFDHLDDPDWHQRLTGTLDLLEGLGDRRDFRTEALANFERLVDQDQLVRDVCEPLLHIREAPVSQPI